MDWNRIAAVFITGCSLAACGGGGGNNATSQPDGMAQPVEAAAPPYTISPGILTASYLTGTQQTVYLTALPTAKFSGELFLKVVPNAAVIEPLISITANNDGSYSISVDTSKSIKPGRYKGNITINVCHDANCTTHLAGSPFSLPYDIEVLPEEGSLTTQNLKALFPLVGAPDWETFQGNASHTGYVPVTLNAAAFSARWKITGAATSGELPEYNAIATGAGNIYVSFGGRFDSANRKLVAYREQDGSVAWDQSFDFMKVPSILQPPAYSNGKVYMVAGDQTSTSLYGWDAATGSSLFDFRMKSQWGHYLAPTVFNGVVYAGGGYDGQLYAMSATTGVGKYYMSFLMDGWTPAVTASTLYTYIDGTLRQRDIVSGEAKSAISEPQQTFAVGAPVVGDDGLLFAASGTASFHSLTAFNTLTNSITWTQAGPYSGTPAYADHTLFAANWRTGQLEARKDTTGELLWTWTSPDEEPALVNEVLVTKNLVFVSSSANTYAIDRSTHKPVWSYAAGGKLALSANGVLYIKAANTITAINVK